MHHQAGEVLIWAGVLTSASLHLLSLSGNMEKMVHLLENHYRVFVTTGVQASCGWSEDTHVQRSEDDVTG